VALTNLPATKITRYWATEEGKIPETRLFEVTATTANIPVAGELTHLDANGLHEYLITTAGGATAAARTIAGLCVQEGNEQNALYNPGIQAATYSSQKVLNIGGRGSHTGKPGTIDQRFIMPMRSTFRWVMTRYTDDAIVVGQAYGYRRTAAGVVFLDASITDDVLEVTGIFEPDSSGLSGPLFKATPRVWVRPVLTANL
jgi:hypothetical protein